MRCHFPGAYNREPLSCGRRKIIHNASHSVAAGHKGKESFTTETGTSTLVASEYGSLFCWPTIISLWSLCLCGEILLRYAVGVNLMNKFRNQMAVRSTARALSYLMLACAVVLPGSAQTKPGNSSHAYLDTSLPLEKRVDDLVSRMTIEEKVRQMQHTARQSPGSAFPRTIGGVKLCTAWRARDTQPCFRRPLAWPRPGITT